ncbi:MAG: hypothetical protein CVU39_23675 [Chloroflexi bacterium HGW-Chloroflexi-10]|nr:MAG: hypothetical protein CVU39_23675 [Chloroflexi bacterium HGW-Chloroflexi-10]
MIKKQRLISSIVIILITLILFAIFYIQGKKQSENNLQNFVTGYNANTARAKVISIIEEGKLTLGNRDQLYQILSVEVLDGNYQGQILQVDYGIQNVISTQDFIRQNDTILVNIGERPDTGEIRAFFADFDRQKSLIILFILFVIFSIVISGWKGLRSLVGIAFSLVIILFYILPQILAGKDPVLASITGAFFFLSVSLYLVYGWNLKTHSAVIGIFISLIITGLLSAFFINFNRLTGFGDENVLFLTQMTSTQINMKGLLLAGMLIGALGVLDDLVISQSSSVFELYAANNTLSFKFLYKRSMNIGKDHVAATVNTLFLAYAGASLPMLLLFSFNTQDPWLTINMSLIAEEIVRTLVGSIGLFISIPMTTALAAYVATNQKNYPWLNRYFGPDNQWDGHVHHH